jgi:hypothetical protein
MEGARLFPIVDKMPLVSDFFRADCRARDGSFYSNIHSGIMFDAGLHMRYCNCLHLFFRNNSKIYLDIYGIQWLKLIWDIMY